MPDLRDQNQESIELLLGGVALICYGALCVVGAPIMVAMDVGNFFVKKIKKVNKKRVH